MNTKKRILYWLFLILLFAINIYIITQRSNGYRYYPYSTYTQLYLTDSSQYIKDIFFNKDSVTITLSKPLQQSNYSFFLDNEKQSTITALQNTISFPIQENIHHYKLQSSDSLTFTIDHSKAEDSVSYINEVVYTNLIITKDKAEPLTNYITNKTKFKPSAIEEAKQILATKTNFYTVKSTQEKALAIAAYIASLPVNKQGLHYWQLAKLSAIEQLHLAQKNRANLACGNYASLIHFFATAGNLPNRIVSFRNNDTTWQFGAHTWNEIFIQEKNAWAVLDGMSNCFLPTKQNGFLLNSMDINSWVKLNTSNTFSSYTYKNDSLQLLPYDSVNALHEYYNALTADLVFIYPNATAEINKLSNFFQFYTFTKNQLYYNPYNSNNWGKILFKMLSIISLVVVFICYCIVEIKLKLKK